MPPFSFTPVAVGSGIFAPAKTIEIHDKLPRGRQELTVMFSAGVSVDV